MTAQDPHQPRVSEPGNPDPLRQALGRGASSQLIHELANLLDGCLRNIGLVMTDLKQSSPGPQEEGAHGDEQNMLPRLETANQAMNQMILLIDRWRSESQPSPRVLHDQPETLGQIVELATRLLVPRDAVDGFNVTIELPDDIAALSSGPVYPVIANALRNSIEAVAAANPNPSRICIRLTGQWVSGQVELRIEDNGPGLDPAVTDEAGKFIFGRSTKNKNRGVGLILSREIAHSLGGTIELINRPDGGAALTLRYPIEEIVDPSRQ